MTTLFSNPLFIEAMADIESLGFRVTEQPVDNCLTYVIVGGRSNARWWLIPLQKGRITASGLARMVELGGTLGKLAAVSRHFFLN